MSTGNRRRSSKPLHGLFSFPLPKRAPSTGPSIGEKIASSAMRPSPAQAPASYLFLFVMVTVFVTCGMLFHLHLRFEGVWLGYETSRARSERAQLVAERRELRLELSSLKSPERIESEAREKLGMEMPGMDQIVPMNKKVTPILASGRAR